MTNSEPESQAGKAPEGDKPGENSPAGDGNGSVSKESPISDGDTEKSRSSDDESKPADESESSDESQPVWGKPSGEVPPPDPERSKLFRGKQTLTQIHLSRVLDEVQQHKPETGEEPSEPSAEDAPMPSKGRIGITMVFDILLGIGLLVTMGGFGVGIFHMYLVHSAQQSINQQNYEAAIVIIKGAPLPELFCMPGTEAEELLNQALYLDAVEKLNTGDAAKKEEGIKELQQIRAGSKFFLNAHKLIGETDEPAPVMLQGGAETVEEHPVPEKPKSLLDEVVKDEQERDKKNQSENDDNSN